MRTQRITGAVCSVLALSLAACGGSSSLPESPTPTPTTATLSVQPSLGLISGADVNLKSLNGSVIATTTTGADGIAKFTLSAEQAKLTGPFLLEVTGKAGAKYYDEGLNIDIELPAGNTLHTLINRLDGSVGVTALTEIAYERALKIKAGKLETISNADVEQANEEIRLQFAPELKHINSAPQLVSKATAAGALGDTEAGRYALKLTALAKLAAQAIEETTAGASTSDDVKSAIKAQLPALKLAKQLAADFADGKLDGSDLYLAINFHEKLQDKLSQAAQQLGNEPLLAIVNNLQAMPKPALEMSAAAVGSQIDLAIMGTTDLHTNVKSYDYYKTSEDITLGFERTASLIDAVRKANPNHLLFDDGDTIQGTPLADYQALVSPVSCNTPLAIHKAMNAMRFDAGNIGNHEFNYGLPFLAQVTGASMRIAGTEAGKGCQGPQFPLLLSNVFNATDKRPIFAPYSILSRNFKTADGKTIALKVGVIGFAPPGIMNWDKRNLEGKVYATGVKEAAERYVPEMKKAGADIIVALSHGGISDQAYSPTMENAVYHLAQVPGITAIVSGHSHSFFPDGKNYAGIKDVDNVKGTVKGIPTVMAGFWGNNLGVIKLNLKFDGKVWTTADSKSELKPISGKAADGKTTIALADVKPEISKLVEKEHQATIKFVNTGVGKSDYPISSFLSQVAPTAAMHLINLAQIDYATQFIKANLPQYANLPILSAAAPFKMNFRGGGYTEIAAGDVAIKNIADLYIYANTLEAVKIDGAMVKLWLEKSAEQFNQIDPSKTVDQALIMPTFASYNFDQIDGVTYEIDVTQAKGNRIVNLKLNGQPLDPAQPVIVVTNNYRASGGAPFTFLAGANVIISGGDANRDVIVSYVKTQKQLTLAKHAAVANWRFKPVATQGAVTFETALNTASVNAIAKQEGVNNIVYTGKNNDAAGNAIFSIDLSYGLAK
ncbi:bifunctional 2',3'-cyclic-nucleotide 2'-phosphodiesterase/3'-nucleotidase [Deefgea salmonis]|uniref:Bifunctional 2',3'-cyclic-nucleotide 2'-phosphodiesterase/3'-nucleotidase n=1 Tax=Deefgea salmonis TaxID=2875502 RepID=A0ABS8BJU4_9NEIS|nr:bifunctional 2',3'-cyclic-nucleotide 2'-phosphodiesterase/3'-nucleotidase [Deefgea salmonis]MCB5195998.1 bifunctional 2',3'-cyclic-nucleotide 2'-phosphodiesterase/3'-nucleotidase [Deefgea salmonis]